MKTQTQPVIESFPVAPDRTRIQGGVEWLDKNRPGWWREIDLARLRLERCKDCMIGQLYGDFAEFPPLQAARGSENDYWDAWELSATLGFNISDDDKDLKRCSDPELRQVWDHLGALWTEVILERRAQDANPERS